MPTPKSKPAQAKPKAKASKAVKKTAREQFSKSTVAAEAELERYMKEFWSGNGMAAAAANPEPLDEELAVYRTDGDFPMIKHPILFAIPYTEAMNGQYNRQYAYKKNLIKDYVGRGAISTALGFVERPHRMEFLHDYADKMKHAEYWQTVRWVWTDSENIWQNIDIIEDLLHAERPGRSKNLMDNHERETLSQLPETFRVYRGHCKHNRSGWSWTLSAAKASWFARRFKSGRGPGGGSTFADFFEATIAKAYVRRDKVIAYLTARGEYEIVADPSDIMNATSFRDGVMLCDGVMRLADACLARFKLSKGGEHGPGHWANVLRIGDSLAYDTYGADRLVVQAFAVVHDHARAYEDEDDEHGLNSVQDLDDLLRSAGLSLSSTQRKKLIEACVGHSAGETTTDPTVGCCWDADRVDLIRLGRVPNRELLSTRAAKEQPLGL